MVSYHKSLAIRCSKELPPKCGRGNQVDCMANLNPIYVAMNGVYQ